MHNPKIDIHEPVTEFTMRILASDLSQSLNDLAFLLALGNGAVNFAFSYGMARAMHPGFSVCFVVFLIWSDRLRVENPTLMLSVLGFIGAVGGLMLGLKHKAREEATKNQADKEE